VRGGEGSRFGFCIYYTGASSYGVSVDTDVRGRLGLGYRVIVDRVPDPVWVGMVRWLQRFYARTRSSGWIERVDI
jgi:hypothetical protein